MVLRCLVLSHWTPPATSTVCGEFIRGRDLREETWIRNTHTHTHTHTLTNSYTNSLMHPLSSICWYLLTHSQHRNTSSLVHTHSQSDTSNDSHTHTHTHTHKTHTHTHTRTKHTN